MFSGILLPDSNPDGRAGFLTGKPQKGGRTRGIASQAGKTPTGARRGAVLYFLRTEAGGEEPETGCHKHNGYGRQSYGYG